MPESDPHDYEECSICGRSILRGESGIQFVTPEGSTTLVCALCGERAESVGWVRADMVAETPPGQPRRRGLARLLKPLGRARAAPEPPEPDAVPAPDAPEPDTPEGRLRRAIERFNEGEGPQLVAGLTRSLGDPRVAVRELQGPSRVEITIAWELSWYRWEIGANGNGEPRQVAKGAEVDELASDELDWNATAGADGRLRWPAS